VLSEIQILLLPFVLQFPLYFCSAVQAEPCRATCANATLDMNQLFDLSFPCLALLVARSVDHVRMCTLTPSLANRRASREKSCVKIFVDPLKTSEISKLLKSKKIFKRK
jgi:hypothetical protein